MKSIPQTKRCRKCREEKAIDFFYADKQTRDRLYSWCKPCTLKASQRRYQINRQQRLAQSRLWQQDNPKKRKQYINKWRQKNHHKVLEMTRRAGRLWGKKLKQAIVKAYGGACICCGETHLEFLTIDHINGDGKKHREELKRRGVSFYTFLREQGFPQDSLRLLCMNCNFATRYGKPCPHQTEPSRSS